MHAFMLFSALLLHRLMLLLGILMHYVTIEQPRHSMDTVQHLDLTTALS